jgi:putative ATPase
MPDTLFDAELGGDRPGAPLAARMRPRSLDEVVGQADALAPGSPLRRLVAADDEGTVGDGWGGAAWSSVVLWGPPGSGKTTIASLIAAAGDRRLVELSAITAGVKDVRAVVATARDQLVTGRPTVLFIDEVHRFSKTQQDALLPAVENGWVTLVAATTENPSFAVITPLLSRSIVVRLAALSEEELGQLIDRGLDSSRGLAGRWRLSPPAREALIRLAGGDARRALTALEAAAAGTREGEEIDARAVETAVQSFVPAYDRDGDSHYDIASALIKSVRGSDVDAALHYLARMVAAGEDPRFIARRLVILASEDVGLADPTALPMAMAAMQAVSLIGMPEARLTLAQAVVHLSLAPKSNAVIEAIDAALADVRAGLAPAVPPHLRDAHYAGAASLGHGTGYRYPHADPVGVVAQEYVGPALAERRYYQPRRRGAEAALAERAERLRAIVREGPAGGDAGR